MKLPKFGLNTLFAKIIVLTLVSLLLTVFILLTYQAYQQQQVEEQLSREKLLTDAQSQANGLVNKLNPAYEASATLAEILSAATADSIRQISRKQVNTLLRNVLVSNSRIAGVGTAWEPNAFDNRDNYYKNAQGHDVTGIFIPYWYKGPADSIKLQPYSNYYVKNFYIRPKETQKPYVKGFIEHPVENMDQKVITFSHPIVNKGKFMGVTFVHVKADYLVNTMRALDAEYPKEKVTIYAYDGTILYRSDRPELTGKSGNLLLSEFQKELKNIQTIGKSIYEKGDVPEARVPVKFREANSRWQLRTASSSADVYNAKGQTGIITLLIVLLIVVAIGEFLLLRMILRPLNLFARNSEYIATGNTDIQTDFATTTREFKTLREAFKTVVNYLRGLSEFADELGKENFEVDYKPRSANDTLGHSLLKLKNSLKNARQQEQERQEEEEKRNWINEGLAKFNEILHRHYESQNEMAYFIIKEISDYVEAIQGGLYIYQTEDQEQGSEEKESYLELMAAVAYDERKYLNKQLKLGEELAGACALEQKTIYLTDVPENYIQITSGMGDAPPRNLILVPLTIKDQVYGVIELASFDPLEQHKREFLEKLAESLATTLYSSQINERTARLLEKSKQQAEEMASQEEEMRQNLEELQATQEDLNKKQKDLQAFEKIADIAFQKIVLDEQAVIREVNENFLNNLGYDQNEITGENHRKIIDKSKLNEFSTMWTSITQGNDYHGQARWIRSDGSQSFHVVTYMPVFNENESLEKIICISYDITRSYELEERIKTTTEEMRNARNETDKKQKEIEQLQEEYENKIERQKQINQSLKDELEQYKNE